MIVCKVPARNYHGYTLAKVVGETTDTRGHEMVRVRALHGEPWDQAGMCGWAPTSYAKFYPEEIEIVKECKKQSETVTSDKATVSATQTINYSTRSISHD